MLTDGGSPPLSTLSGFVTIGISRYARDCRGKPEAPDQTDHDSPAASTALFAYTLITSRRYSGVRADVVSGFAVLAASSPTTVAVCSSICFPTKACSAAGTSMGAGFTAVIATRAA